MSGFLTILSESWFIGISTLGTFIGWWTINLTFLRFCESYYQSPPLSKNDYKPCYFRGCLPGPECGPERQEPVRIQITVSTVPRHLGNGLDYVFHPRQWFHGVLQVGPFEVPDFLYAWSLVGSHLSQLTDSGLPDINIPIYIALYLGYKIFYRTKIPTLKEADLFSNIPTMEETERPEVPPTTIWGKIGAVVF